MYRPLALFIGLRYTKSKKKNNFISFISGMSILGIAIGVTILIIVMSVMNGFDQQLKNKILGMVPQAIIYKIDSTIANWQRTADLLRKDPHIMALAPLTQSQGLATANSQVQGILLNGIEPATEMKVSNISKYLINGNLDSLKPNSFNIVIGNVLAQKLEIDLNDKITIMLPDSQITPVGLIPRLKRFTVTGIFSMGTNLDDSMVYININDAGNFLHMPTAHVQSIRIKVDNLFNAPAIAQQAINQLSDSYYANNWTQSYGQLFSAIHMEKMMVGLLLSFLIAIATFNVITTLIMTVIDKQSDIAILRAFGIPAKTIMYIFMIHGFIISLIGTLIGASVGIIGALNISSIVNWIQKIFNLHFLNPQVYFIDFLPSELHLDDIITIVTISLTLSFIATIYPSWKASKTQPATALRYRQ